MQNQRTIHIIKKAETRANGNHAIPSKRKVAAYARVSTEYEDQLNSYRVQCEEYTKAITANPSYHFVGIYADQGLSGTQAKKRPEFMKMIAAAKNGEIDLILTKSISRFGRNVVDVINYVRELRLLNVEIFFEKENISSLDPKIDFMLTILSSIAQEESRAISSNVKWAIEKKAKNGIVDARRILGYDAVDGAYVINQAEAPIIKLIFELALKGFNINDIVKTLNSRGINTLSETPWRYGTIRHILQNERYCGDVLLRKSVCVDYLTKKTVKNNNIVDKYYVSNNHEGIITKEMFDNVQNILSIKSTLRNQGKVSKYPLTGILYCPKCGRTLKRQQMTRGKKDSVVLNCNHSYGNAFICKGGSSKYDLVLAAVSSATSELLANKGALNALFSSFGVDAHLNGLRDKQSQIRAENASLHVALADKPGDEDTIRQITRNNEDLKEISENISLYASASLKLEYIKSIAEKPSHSVFFKDIYSMILADELKVRLVISLTQPITALIVDIPKILSTNPILSNMYVSPTGYSGIYWEIVLYE